MIESRKYLRNICGIEDFTGNLQAKMTSPKTQKAPLKQGLVSILEERGGGIVSHG
jgi:hypothetical protein